MALPLLHLVAGTVDFYVLWYDQKHVNINLVDGLEPNAYPFKNRILLLTMWTLLLQAIYMGIAFLNDLIGTNEASPKNPPAIRKVKDALFSLAYPTGTFVSLSYWSICFVNKDLLTPERIAKAHFPWMNHVMHTFVSVFINIEMFSSNIDYPSMKVNYTLVVLFIVSYAVSITTAYFQTGQWKYIVLGYLNRSSRSVFFIGCIVLGLAFNSFGEILNRKLSSGKVKRQ